MFTKKRGKPMFTAISTCKIVTRTMSEKLGFGAVLPHPHYTPNLAPCNFCLYPKLKGHHKSKRFVFGCRGHSGGAEMISVKLYTFTVTCCGTLVCCK